MTEETIQAALAHYEAQLRQWQESQQDQTDAYEFEKSFAEFAQEAARRTFALVVEPERTGRNHQKK